MAEWCQKCGTYHDVTTAGGCPDKEDKLWVGTYAEGFRAGQEAAERRVAALVKATVGTAPEYTPACFDCRRLSGKQPAGVKLDDLCEWHANAWVAAYRAALKEEA